MTIEECVYELCQLLGKPTRFTGGGVSWTDPLREWCTVTLHPVSTVATEMIQVGNCLHLLDDLADSDALYGLINGEADE